MEYARAEIRSSLSGIDTPNENVECNENEEECKGGQSEGPGETRLVGL